MKRIDNIYSRIYDIVNVRRAYMNARKKKTHYTEVKKIDKNPEAYLQQIHQMLKDRTFRNAPYEVFTKTDHKKKREIFKLPFFPDRIIHHCILQIVEPIWNSLFVRDTYSSIKKRGIHDGVQRLKLALEDKLNTLCCLKIDVRKFYPSIDHDILKAIIRRKIKDPFVLWLMDEIIDSTKGIPIGNYLSQFFGNLYLTYFDHWVKQILKIRYYLRYCDDMVFLYANKTKLHLILNKVKIYLLEHLKLDLKSNFQVFPVASRGIDFLGYVFFQSHTLVRKSIVQDFKKLVKEIMASETLSKSQICALSSYHGWLIHADSYYLSTKYLLPITQKHGYINKAFLRYK